MTTKLTNAQRMLKRVRRNSGLPEENHTILRVTGGHMNGGLPAHRLRKFSSTVLHGPVLDSIPDAQLFAGPNLKDSPQQNKKPDTL